jgi:amino acid permease
LSSGSLPTGSFGSHYSVGLNFEDPPTLLPSHITDLNETPCFSSLYGEHTPYNALHKDMEEVPVMSEHAPLLSLSRCSSVSSLPNRRPTPAPSVVSVSLVEKKSTFFQSVFNALNVLMGIAVLALPFAFHITGWALGLIMMLAFAWVTRYTVGILRDCMAADPSLATFADIGHAAFGHAGRSFLTVVLLLEVIASSVAIVIILSDSLVAIYPSLEPHPYLVKGIAWVVLTPTTWLALRWLAYGSVLGVISTTLLVVVVVWDGLSKFEAPGSLWQWADDIHAWPTDWSVFPISFGLLMAGFAGHTVFPSIYRDMDQPNNLSSMANVSYAITLASYVTMAMSGYLMFGGQVKQEITQNIAQVPEYPRLLNMLTLYTFLLIPLTKYSLNLNPLFLVVELRLMSAAKMTRLCRILVRTGLSTVVCVIAAIFPGFHRVVSLMGSFNAFTICAIFPILCHWRIFGRKGTRRVLDSIVLLISIFCACTGTIWSFI